MADETAGSDLDGDMYVVIGDPEIVSNFSASMPYLATPIPPHTSSEVSGGTALWRGSQAYGEASGGGRGGISGDTVTLLELEPEAASPAASALRSMTTYYLLLTTTTYYLLLTTYYLLLTSHYLLLLSITALLLPYLLLPHRPPMLSGAFITTPNVLCLLCLLRCMCFAYYSYGASYVCYTLSYACSRESELYDLFLELRHETTAGE